MLARKNTAASRSSGALTTSTTGSGSARRMRSPSYAGSSRSGTGYREPSSRKRTRSPSFEWRDRRETGRSSRERSPSSRSTRSPSYAGSCRSGTNSHTGRSPPLRRDRYYNVKREPYEEETCGLREERRGDWGYSRSRVNGERDINDTSATYDDARFGRGGSREGSSRDRRDSWSSNESRVSYHYDRTGG